MAVERSFFFGYIAGKYGSDFNYPVQDVRGVVCYITGGVIAGGYWNYELIRSRDSDEVPQAE